jgi:hypothetical protein
MVEEEFMACRSSERAGKLKESPISLPAELRMGDRRDLDLAVYELIGVPDSKEREKLCDELYFETARHFREIRIVEIKNKNNARNRKGEDYESTNWRSMCGMRLPTMNGSQSPSGLRAISRTIGR